MGLYPEGPVKPTLKSFCSNYHIYKCKFKEKDHKDMERLLVEINRYDHILRNWPEQCELLAIA
jgi:hypothetical protein